MAKITKTYSINDKIYEAFEQVSDEKNINKSSFIEGCINKYLEDNNRYGVNKKYVLKTDPNYKVSINRQDDTFYYLSDGSKMPIILFMQMYKEIEQVNEFNGNSNEVQRNVNVGGLSKTGFEGLDKINS